jgi:hypothetical protein
VVAVEVVMPRLVDSLDRDFWSGTLAMSEVASGALLASDTIAACAHVHPSGRTIRTFTGMDACRRVAAQRLSGKAMSENWQICQS